jgi:hypothetical protein
MDRVVAKSSPNIAIALRKKQEKYIKYLHFTF